MLIKCKYCACLDIEIALYPRQFTKHLAEVHNKTIRQHTLFTVEEICKNNLCEISELTCRDDYIFYNINEFIFNKNACISFKCKSMYVFDCNKYYAILYATPFTLKNNLSIHTNILLNMQKFEIVISNLNENLKIEKGTALFQIMLCKYYNNNIKCISVCL